MTDLDAGLPMSEFGDRLDRTYAAMDEAGLAALFVYGDEYRPGMPRYYSNFNTINVVEESTQAVFLPRDGAPVLFVGSLNADGARRQSWIADVRSAFELDVHLPELARVGGRVLERLGLAGGDVMPLNVYTQCRRALPDTEFVPADHVVTGLRAIKSEAEIRLMRRAAQLADESLKAAIDEIAPGKTEVEISAIGEYVTRLGGGEIGSAYLVVSGPKTAAPAARPDERKIQAGELVWIDFNPRVGGYCCDAGLTVVTEGASQTLRDLLRFAYETNDRMIEAVRPGMPAIEVFRRTSEIVREAGYLEYFEPFTVGMRAIGHGVGLDVVEHPDLGPGSDYQFLPNMTLGIKFDLHGPDFGLRVERTVLVTESGAEPLNAFPRAAG